MSPSMSIHSLTFIYYCESRTQKSVYVTHNMILEPAVNPQTLYNQGLKNMLSLKKNPAIYHLSNCLTHSKILPVSYYIGNILFYFKTKP